MNGIKTEPFIDLTGVKTEPGLSTWTGIKSEPAQPSLTLKSEPNAAQYRAQLQTHKHYDNLSGILPGPSGRTTQRAPDQNSNWPEVPGISPDVVNQIDRLANIDHLGRKQIMKMLNIKNLSKGAFRKIKKISTPTQGICIKIFEIYL